MSKRTPLRMLALVTASAALGAVAHADIFNVYTGYADNLRASGFFPTPWLGDAGIVSETPFGQSSDAGAIRIDNKGVAPIVITDLTVTMNGGSGPVYAIWQTLSIGAGQDGIFTQTGSYNFDTSDNANNAPSDVGNLSGASPGSNGIGGCSSTAAAQATAGITAYCAGRQPIITFDENGVPVTLNDSGHILDTGNYDFINGSTDGNESINWNLVGTLANRGGSSAPEPSTWAMMLLGFAGIGMAARRRSNRAALAA